MRTIIAAELLLLVSVMTGCPGTLEEPERFDEALAASEVSVTSLAECGDVETEIVHATCGTGDCHSARTKIADLDLETPGVLTRLAQKPGSRGGTLIVAGKPEASLLFQKVTSRPPYGTRMPSAEAALDDVSRDCVRLWIAEAK